MGKVPLWFGDRFLENYRTVLSTGMRAAGPTPVGVMMWNSLVMAVGIAVGKIAISILSAYAIVYFRFPLRMACFWMIFLTLMLPVEVRIMPTFKVVADLGLLNTYAGLTIPLIASATATFLFRQFFLTVPEELLEAARIDGAGPLRFFWSILVPLSRTNIAALFVILFIFGWNQYLWPLLMTTQEGMYTIVLGIKRMTAAARGGGGLEPRDGDGDAGHGAAGGHRGPDAALVHQGPHRAGEMRGVRGRRLRSRRPARRRPRSWARAARRTWTSRPPRRRPSPSRAPSGVWATGGSSGAPPPTARPRSSPTRWSPRPPRATRSGSSGSPPR